MHKYSEQIGMTEDDMAYLKDNMLEDESIEEFLQRIVDYYESYHRED